jgi:DNA-directed RNA polymerase subunit alpha
MALTITIYLDSPNDLVDFTPVLLEAVTKLKERLEEPQKDILSRDIDTLELSVRVVGALREYRIRTLGELILYSSRQLKTLRHIGSKALREIEDALAEVGLGLRKDS